MRSRAISFLLLILIIIIPQLSACSSNPPVSTVDATQGAQLLAGTYTMSLTKENIQNAEIPSFETGLESNIGNWQFILTPDGKFSAELNENFIAEGNYEVTGNKIVIGVDSVCTDCSCAGNIGRYYWALNGDKLIFQEIADSCNGMVLLLTSNPLTRQP